VSDMFQSSLGFPATKTLGMLVRSVPVQVRDMSRGGCLIETCRPIRTGAAGQLRVEIDGIVHLDDIRVCRCQQRAGNGSVYSLGVELLKARRLTRRSLRLALPKMVGRRDVMMALESSDDRPPGALEGSGEREEGVGRAPPARDGWAAAADGN